MSRAQRLGVVVVYAAIAASGAAYAFLEHHQASRLVHIIKDVMPAFLVLLLMFLVYAFFRTVVSALKELNGVCRAAHVTRYADYGKR
jgi:mannose/fructose/N-acetylgalactosamine-specific phosphotransferase system component IID